MSEESVKELIKKTEKLLDAGKFDEATELLSDAKNRIDYSEIKSFVSVILGRYVIHGPIQEALEKIEKGNVFDAQEKVKDALYKVDRLVGLLKEGDVPYKALQAQLLIHGILNCIQKPGECDVKKLRRWYDQNLL